VLADLAPGRYEVDDTNVTKDFLVYSVESHGFTGYVIFDAGVTPCTDRK
jgi:hypothetical protein